MQPTSIHRHPRRVAGLGVATAALLLLAACGSDDDGGSSATTTGSSATTAAGATTTAGSGATTSAGGATECAEPVDLTIGQVLSVTGPFAEFVKPHFNGVELAVEDLNAEGKVNVKVITGDAVNTPATAVAAFESIIGDNPTAIIGAPLSTQTEAIAAAAADAGVILLAPNAIPVQDFGPLSFNAIPNFFDYQIPAAMETFWEVYGDGIETAIYVGNKDYATGQQVNEARRKFMEEKGVKTIAVEETLASDTDFSALAGKIASENPDVVFEDMQQSSVFWRQLADAGYEGLKFGSGAIGSPASLAAAGGALEGALTFLSWSPKATESEFAEEWVKRYEDRYGLPPGQFAPAIYDSVRLLGMAAAAACSNDPVKVAEQLTQVELADGVTGSPQAFDDNRTMPSNPVLVKIVGEDYEPVTG